jgi:hypothetical protein
MKHLFRSPFLLIVEAEMAAVVRHKGPVQLRFDDGKVVVTPEDQDRFVLAADSAVSACQMMNAGLELRRRFTDEYLTRVFQWSQQHADGIQSVYVAFQDVGLSVFVVGSSGEYDFKLDDPISDLEAEMEDKGWTCDIVQLPTGDVESRRSFFDEEKSIEVYAKRS